MSDTLFDSWTDRYDSWFDTPWGRQVKAYESRVLADLLAPRTGERILDAGCGTGIFTGYVLDAGVSVVGIDLSRPMIEVAVRRHTGRPFTALCADLCRLPFPDNYFDRTFSMTAIEFVADAGIVIAELNRVTRPGGCIVVTTLNSLSPWAAQRREKAKSGHALFRNMYFRSPDEMTALVPGTPAVRTAIHFKKSDPVSEIPAIETLGTSATPDTGAFLAVQWRKTADPT